MNNNSFLRLTKEKTISCPIDKFLIYLDDNSHHFKRISLKTENGPICFYKKHCRDPKLFYRNSFSLDTAFSIDELNNTVKITLKLNRGVKIFFGIYIFFAFAFEVLLLYFHLASDIETWTLLIPILLIVSATTILYAGFSLSSKLTLARHIKTIKTLNSLENDTKL